MAADLDHAGRIWGSNPAGDTCALPEPQCGSRQKRGSSAEYSFRTPSTLIWITSGADNETSGTAAYKAIEARPEIFIIDFVRGQDKAKTPTPRTSPSSWTKPPVLSPLPSPGLSARTARSGGQPNSRTPTPAAGPLFTSGPRTSWASASSTATATLNPTSTST